MYIHRNEVCLFTASFFKWSLYDLQFMKERGHFDANNYFLKILKSS